jgi:hypothetical protein
LNTVDVLDIIFKSSEEDIEGGPAAHITEMWIPGLDRSGDTENRYSVSKISSRYWRVDGYVELWVWFPPRTPKSVEADTSSQALDRAI